MRDVVLAVRDGLSVEALGPIPDFVRLVRVAADVRMDEIIREIERGGLLILVDQGEQSILAHTIDAELQLRKDVRFVPAGLCDDKSHGWIGPTKMPSGEGSCFRCSRLRQIAASGEWRAAMEREIAEGQGCEPAFDPIAVERGLHALSGELAQIMSEMIDPRLLDHVLRIGKAERVFVPVASRPDCDRCRPSVTDGDDLRSILDPSGGIVRTLESHAIMDGALWTARAELANSWLSPGWEIVTLGKGTTREAAEMSALGEAVERYCSTNWGRALSAPPVETRSIPIEAFAAWPNLDLERAKEVPPEQKTVAMGQSLPTGDPVALPGATVFLDHPARGEPGYCGRPNTNGVGAGPNALVADMAALTEIVERDAIMRAWRDRRCLGRIAPNSPAISRIEHWFASLDKEGFLVDLALVETSAPMAVIVAIIRGKSADILPHVAVGSAAGSDVGTAARSAIFEAVQVVHELRTMLGDPVWRQRAEDLVEGRAAAEGPFDHALYHALLEDAEPMRFLLEAPQIHCDAEEAGRSETAAIANALAQRGIECFKVDLTTPDLECAGWHCSRILSPQLVNLAFGEEARLRAGHAFLHPLG